MKKLGKTGYSILKLIHLFFVGTWVGGGWGLLLLTLGLRGDDLSGMLRAVHMVDLMVVVPAAVGSLLTGVLFSIFTNWGFFKHRWVTAKYIVNLIPMILGGIVPAPHLVGMMEIAAREGARAMADPAFLYHKGVFTLFVIPQFVLILVAFWLSVFKPGLGKKRVESRPQCALPPSMRRMPNSKR